MLTVLCSYYWASSDYNANNMTPSTFNQADRMETETTRDQRLNFLVPGLKYFKDYPSRFVSQGTIRLQNLVLGRSWVSIISLDTCTVV